ncbi:hypothetical protein EK21DRAFT_68043 [Setomelanomma holmii]|uniref:Uncharacterized protein n=1 Tax=Setomelanomma holmii TaxID=210430 RepID=A0A9P4H8X5_9PLEO|nr:hypothetical protein EK21DRAFT_68043 [Setomelanomma holmii]
MSIFSATNENYAALANVKFDFSLVKMEAPFEFSGIASALSARRKVEAEEGPAHKTARRLGALFEDLVPSTPKLISACGLRISEIINTSGVNDVGTDKHGPFEPYVGADGTTLWAAATSGIPAIAVYLLGCLLTRAWDAKTATSIWVQLVAARQDRIKEEVQNNRSIFTSSVVGACQDITRKDLALWDHSIRAWFRRADKAKEWSEDQLALVRKNIVLPVSGGSSTYDDVMNVWKRSMLTVEHFLAGKPQEITDGSVLLAFSAWHLYPDLVVLGAHTIKVSFKDKLVPSTAVGTVGATGLNVPEREGIQWSLALSHLQYYGDPVVVASDQDYSRVTFSQLQIVALGSLLGAWKISFRDYLSVAEWFTILGYRIGMSEEARDDQESSDFGWLLQFVVAARRILASRGQEHEQNLRLLKHGSRRAKKFLSDLNCSPSPFFGLLDTLTIHGLQQDLDVDSGIAYLRAIADNLGLQQGDAIICYAHDALHYNVASSVECYELATVQSSDTQTHARWICRRKRSAHDAIHEPSRYESYAPVNRMKSVSEQGEACNIYATGPHYDSHSGSFTWSNAPSIYSQSTTYNGNDEMDVHTEVESEDRFDSIVGNWRLGLFLHCRRRKPLDLLPSYKDRIRFLGTQTASSSAGMRNFKDKAMVSERLKDYLCSLMQVSEPHWKQTPLQAPGVSIISSAHKFHPTFSMSVYALASASRIYDHLDQATISLKLIKMTLHNAAWARCLLTRWQPEAPKLTSTFNQTPLLTHLQPPLPDRHETFSCIAFFDTGTVDFNPTEFKHSFALCSEDTIYVPAIILSDPFTQVAEYEMKSILGNIGRQGLSILVPPFEPRVRKPSDSYNLITHAAYDFKREDNFRGTSLHLSFTDWTFPLAAEGSRMIDHDAQIVEAVISVRDRGQWVADIDILEVDFQDMVRFDPLTSCNGIHDEDYDFDYTSIDSWEELLDEPPGVGIFRAHGNWAARLAAVSVLSRSGSGGHNFGLFGPEPFCLKCLENKFEAPTWNMSEYESTLPSFCID